MSPTDRLFLKYQSKGLLIDTNILLLLLIGNYNRELIGVFKRVQQFTVADFELLLDVCGVFKKIISTPSILTETSNLAGHLRDSEKEGFAVVFKAFVEGIEESHRIAVEIVADSFFPKFGLTDTQIKMAAGDYLILTDDLRLANSLARCGVDAVNFNHLRLEWGL